MSARTTWQTARFRRFLGWLRRLSGRGAVSLSAATAWVLRRVRASALWDTAVRPFHIATAALLGAGYAPLLLTALGALSALAVGLVKARPALAELEAPLLLGVSLLLPTVGLTVSALAMGIGAIVGIACAVTDAGLWLGLEWAAVGGLGVSGGLLIASAPPIVALAGLFGGGLIGGSVGLLTWLCCTHRTHERFTGRWAVSAGIAVLVCAVYTAWIVLSASGAPPS
jgi:hypothetical protein